MEAKEFVKKFGWGEAKARLNNNIDMFYLGWGFYSEDLKALVDAWDLVDRYGTSDEAKDYLPMLRLDSYDELKQATELVEQCQ